VALCEAALVYGHVTITQLVLAKEIAKELFKLSAQPQFCLHLNCCAVHTSRNNGDLIKQTHRERRLRVLPIFSGRPAIFLSPQSLTHTAVVRGRIWLCAFGPAALLGSTPLSYGITTHYLGDFHGCWFDQTFSCCLRRFCSCIFPSNRKRSMHCFTVGVSFYS